MVRHLLRNRQVTLPIEAVKFFNLKEQDLLEVKFDTLGIHLKPVAIEDFSEEEYAKLAQKLDALKRKKSGRKTYSTTAGVRRHLDRLMKK